MLQGKQILVTGAASGMGAATVAQLLDLGASVVAVDRDADGLERVVGGHERARTIVLDLTDADAINRALSGLRLDGVANIAGVGPDVEDIGLIFAVNLLAPVRVLQAVRSTLAAGASVVNIASIVGSLADDAHDDLLDDPMASPVLAALIDRVADGPSAYTYSKRGILRTSQRLALEWAPAVRVNVISPGLVNTPLGKRSLELPWTMKLSARIPMERHAEPEEIASVVAFLLGDGAAYVTGVDLPVDGGYVAGQLVRKRSASARV